MTLSKFLLGIQLFFTYFVKVYIYMYVYIYRHCKLCGVRVWRWHGRGAERGPGVRGGVG